MSAATLPLSISWRDWLQAGDWNDREFEGPAFDAIVVGSGYGGSVAALRLAQKNYKVLLLERGSEYLPGEFPNDFSLLPKFFRANIPTMPNPMGRATGLVEVHLGQGMVAVTGNGLGGGSLINAGVVMQPDADVFAQPQWPAAIRHGPGSVLAPFFRKARQQLRVRPWDAELPGGGRLHKTAALERLGRQLGVEATGVNTTIDPARCMRCGDCASGCNVPDAKGSLPETYLRAALATGRVQIVTQAEVYRFEPALSDAGAHQGWRVHAFATDAQQQFTATREVFSDTRRAGTGRTLVAPLLFVCAGALGSTQLLQRSQARAPHRLAFSPALGARVSTNGDSLSWVVDEPDTVGSLGRGQAGVEQWKQAQAHKDYERSHIVGPTITGVVDLRRQGSVPLEQRLVLEDGAVPRAIAQLYRELLATASALKSLDEWWFRSPPKGDGKEDPLAASDRRAQHSQLLLVMGHDGSPGRLVWLDGSDRTAPYLPEPEKLRSYQQQQKLFDRMGARHVHNPLWQPMPRTASELMSGPRPQPTLSTVHPLGGCVMHDDPECGVVDDLGRVWVRDPGAGRLPDDAMERPGGHRLPGERNEPRLHKGLYVLDGAIVPTSLGCNPLWTITALAERALDAIPARLTAATLQVRQAEARSPQAPPSGDVAVDAVLHEVLLASRLRAGGGLRPLLPGDVSARFEADFRSDDIQGDMRSERHPLQVRAKLLLGGDEAHGLAQLEYRARRGTFEPLPANAGSSGPWLLLRTLGEILLLLVLACGGRALGMGVLPGLLLFAVGLVVLPLPRTVFTWIVLRLVRDLPMKELRGAPLSRRFAWFLTFLRHMLHASEKRVMKYRVSFFLHTRDADAPRCVTLHASKTVMYRASIRQLLKWLWKRGKQQELRPTFWEQTMNAQVRVVPAGRPWWWPALLAGTFRMGFDNLTSSGLSTARRNAHGAMELGPGGDTTSGMLALASYPMLFLRFALKTRLLDFRLPSYSGRPLADKAPAEERRLRLRSGSFAPAELHRIQVARGSSNSDTGEENQAPLELPLWRYRARDAQDRVVPTPIAEGSWMGVPVARARSVLLLHAFGQSGLSYTLKTIPENLAESLQRAGYEVWVLEMRMSTRTGYADDPCSIDQIAQNDVAGAVQHILDTLGSEQPQRHKLQIAAFAQCIGSAALWMALLSGALSHGIPARHRLRGAVPSLSKLSHFMSSQVHPWVVGARGTQAKTWLPALLQAVWKRGSVPFAVRGPQEGVLLPMLDRVLATLPVPALEDRRVGDNEDANATCRRIRFIEAPLFRHENIGDATFAAMNRLFGVANLRLFTHARRFVDRERLVDEDGVNRYLTDDNLREHAALPIQLLHGRENELFDVSSAELSFGGLGNFQWYWQRRFCVRRDGKVGPVLVPGYGHLDVLIGERAHEAVFPEIVHFMDCVLRTPRQRARQPIPAGWVPRPPRLGPFVGWLRREGEATLLRVSFVIDEGRGLPRGSKLPVIVLRYRLPQEQRFRTWKQRVEWNPVLAFTDPEGERVPAQRLAMADLPLEGPAAAAEAWQVLTLHPSWHGAELELLPSSNPPDAVLDAFLARHDAEHERVTVVPPLSDSQAFRYADAEFRLPPRALQTLPAESDAVPFAVACCRHPGLGPDQGRVDRELGRFLQGEGRDVAFSMLLGDQIYADATAGLVDPTSPLERFFERHETAFRRDRLGQLLAAMPVYMTPDDHEWGDGYPSGGPLVREPWPDWSPDSGFERRERRAFLVAAQAMMAFQRLQSPQGKRPRRWYPVEHGCVRMFVIDTRYSRQRNRPEIVRHKVLAELAQWLAEPQAKHSLNVVASGTVVLPGLRMNADPANPGAADTWQYAPAQRQALLELLVREAPGRFLLLSGDYHVSGAVQLELAGRPVGAAVLAPPLYAPMPYANAAPEWLNLDEEIALPAGKLTMRVPDGGAIARGSGLGVLDVKRQPGGGFSVGYSRNLWVWEDAARTEWKATVL